MRASLIVLLLLFPAAAKANIEYLRDPVYQKLAPEDEHPMQDMMLLADEGDVRAQFILGNMYAKGQGGLEKNIAQARQWFEKSARNGYYFSFIRLAALAKHANNPAAAYKWYSLAADKLGGKDRAWAVKARQELLAEAKLTPDQLKGARAAARAWLENRNNDDSEKEE